MTPRPACRDAEQQGDIANVTPSAALTALDAFAMKEPLSPQGEALWDDAMAQVERDRKDPALLRQGITSSSRRRQSATAIQSSNPAQAGATVSPTMRSR
jgi:hypothetical protein